MERNLLPYFSPELVNVVMEYVLEEWEVWFGKIIGSKAEIIEALQILHTKNKDTKKTINWQDLQCEVADIRVGGIKEMNQYWA
jgi:hypothetical protein